MYCPSCGTLNGAGNLFCQQCGYPISLVEPIVEKPLYGRLSDMEYANLVSATTMEAQGIGSTKPQSEITSPPQDDHSSISAGVPLDGVGYRTSRKIPLRGLLVGGIIIVAAIVLFIVTRPGSPTESKEYKQLLQSKSDLNSEIKDLSSKLVDIAPIQVEFDSYSRRIERNEIVLRDLESIS